MNDRAACDLLVRGRFVLPMTDGLPVIEDGAVVVTGGRIVEVGPWADISRRVAPRDELEGGIVLPGLVNCHGHAAMTLYRGLGDDLPLQEWLERVVWPAELAFTSRATVAAGTRLAVAEMLSSGTTTFADMYYFQDVVGEVCADAGMRVLLGSPVIGFPTPESKDADASLAKCEELAGRYAGHPLVRTSLGLHAVYTVSPELLERGAATAERLGIPIQIHMSETADEVANCLRDHGLTPPRLLERTGVLRRGTVCAHGVHMTEDDVACVRDAGAGVAVNPASNLKLGSGVPDVAEWLASGLRLGLGTDGAASSNVLDLWDAVRLTALLPKGVRRDPTLVAARDAVCLATRGGAEVLGIGNVAGTLEPGKCADLCLIDTTAPHLTPVRDPWALLAYSARGSDVLHTVVDGRVVYRSRRHQTLDVAAVVAEVSDVAEQMGRAPWTNRTTSS